MNDEELIDEMVRRLCMELKGLLAQVRRGQMSAAALEGVLRQQLWHVGAQVMGVLLEALDRELVSGRAVHDHRTRTVVSLFGPLDVTRSRCRDGQGWCYPLDKAMGLGGHRGWSVGVREAVSLLSCESGFGKVSDLMGRLLGVSISAPTVQQVAEAAGAKAQEMLEAETRGSAVGRPSVLKPCSARVPDTLIVSTDGCQAPQRDGWHEVKVATLYPKAARCRSPGGRGKLLEKGYFATLDRVEGFGGSLRACVRAWGGQGIRRVVVMGDGAPWIWNLADFHFPGAIEIADFYHAAKRVWEMGELLWGDRASSIATRTWSRRYCRYLKRGRVDLVMGAMERGLGQRGAGLSGKQAKLAGLHLDYFRRNRSRMRYGRFRQMRLPIGTGAAEGSCKFLVQSRFKLPGSRWSHEGLKNMLALKLLRVNEHWESLWPHLKAG
jgi:hypothetical protein